MKKTGKRTWWQKVKRLLLWLLILQFVYIIILRWIDPPFTITQVVSLLKGNGLKRDYVSYGYMNNSAKLAVMAGEDQLFPDHNGFDVKAIKHKLYIEQIKISCAIIVNRKHLFQLYTHKHNINNTTKVKNHCKTFHNFLASINCREIWYEMNRDLKSFNKLYFII